MSNKATTQCRCCAKIFEYNIPGCCSILCGNRVKAANNRFWDVASSEEIAEVTRKRFERHVIRKSDPDECWGWSGGHSGNGYAQIYLKNPARAHRVSWTMHYGDLTPGKHVLHKCDNRECTNPKHLFLGNHNENMKDMALKGRSPSKLSVDEVIEIKKKLKNNEPIEEMAIYYKVSCATIRDIKAKRRRSHIEL